MDKIKTPLKPSGHYDIIDADGNIICNCGYLRINALIASALNARQSCQPEGELLAQDCKCPWCRREREFNDIQNQWRSELQAERTAKKQANNPIEELKKACEAIQKQEKVLGAIIEKGQGTWPDRDYIKDDDWHGYLGERSALMFVLNRLKAALGEEVKDDS